MFPPRFLIDHFFILHVRLACYFVVLFSTLDVCSSSRGQRVPQSSSGLRAQEQEDHVLISVHEEVGFCGRPRTHTGGEDRRPSAHAPRVQAEEVLTVETSAELQTSADLTQITSFQILSGVFFFGHSVMKLHSHSM